MASIILALGYMDEKRSHMNLIEVQFTDDGKLLVKTIIDRSF